jgi:hypothetical protein
MLLRGIANIQTVLWQHGRYFFHFVFKNDIVRAPCRKAWEHCVIFKTGNFRLIYNTECYPAVMSCYRYISVRLYTSAIRARDDISTC